jgi:hypothetical protein
MTCAIEFHVFTTHTASADDSSPLELISAGELARYRAIEQSYAELCAAVASLLVKAQFVGPDAERG